MTNEQNEVAKLQQMVQDLKKELREGKPGIDSELIEREIAVLFDPYDIQNPFKIDGTIPPDNEYPEGQVLRWLSPKYRDRRGKRGWVFMTWDDAYATEALKCVKEPPERMVGPAGLDNNIRRADLVLGRLDARVFESRRMKPVLESMRRRGNYDESTITTLRKGVSIVGEGSKRDENPYHVEKRGSNLSTFDPGTGSGSAIQELTNKDNNG